MDKQSILYLLGLFHDMAARLEDYLTYDEPKVKEILKSELFQVLRDIQVTTLSISNDIPEEE